MMRCQETPLNPKKDQSGAKVIACLPISFGRVDKKRSLIAWLTIDCREYILYIYRMVLFFHIENVRKMAPKSV